MAGPYRATILDACVPYLHSLALVGESEGAQPDHILSVFEAFAEIDQIKWSLGHDKILADAWQGMLVKRRVVSKSTRSEMRDR